MSWLIPSIPSLPGWSRAAPASSSQTQVEAKGEEEEDADLDRPPMFPLPDSAQRSAAPAFAVQPPSPTRSLQDEAPSDLNIAIMPGTIPLGEMPLPHSTTTKPAFGIKAGGDDSAMKPPAPIEAKPKAKAKGKGGKVALAPGCSALDWARLTQSGQNLRGTAQFPMRVTMDELKKHNKPDDAWSAFNGRVYNITPYLPFHPGGHDELMRVAGRDGTKLFMLTHSWVNLEFMLQECMVGMLVRA